MASGADDERPDEDWFLPLADLSRYAQHVNYAFRPYEGRRGYLEIVSAGRQTAQYAARISRFDWDRFFTVFGGGIFLEAVKAKLRADYDYVLIDSRTGVSDTAGICTVQMPNELVVCFTLNRQSLAGATAIAHSALAQRTGSVRNGGSALRIWPVPTRIEDAEKQQRDRMQAWAMQNFAPLLPQIPAAERELYWGQVAIRYQPFYAYEETLAVLGDRPHTPGSMLSATEAVARYLTDGRVKSLAPMSETERMNALARFERAAAVPAAAALAVAGERRAAHQIFVCYSSGDLQDDSFRLFIDDLGRELRVQTGGEAELWADMTLTIPGEDWREQMSRVLSKASLVLAMLSPYFLKSEQTAREIEAARSAKRHVMPIAWIATLRPSQYRNHPVREIMLTSAIGATAGLRDMLRRGQQSTEYRVALANLVEEIQVRIDSDGAPTLPVADPARNAIQVLSTRYAEVRESMPSGPARTRVMEGITAEMRNISLEVRHLLPELKESAQPGERLTAIAILQAHPDVESLPWLAERIGRTGETPFVDYHAAVALRMAAANLPPDLRPEVERAVRLALRHARSRRDADRDRTLRLTLQEIQERPVSVVDGFLRAFISPESTADPARAVRAFSDLRRMAEFAGAAA